MGHEDGETFVPASVDITAPPFNAFGDGQTDDSAAFQRAVDWLRGRTLHFPQRAALPRSCSDKSDDASRS